MLPDHHRIARPATPVVARAAGAEIWDTAGKRYLDAAGGAIVVNIGHGVESVARVMAEQAERVAFAHGTAFTSEALEAYAAELGPLLPLEMPAIYPVSGGSEAIETALKMARAYHLAQGEPERLIVISRWGSYHGNTLGALDLSGRKPLRRPYEPWLGRFRHVSAIYPYRADEPEAQALGTAANAAEELDQVIRQAGPGTVAAFVAEPVVGATLGAVVPPDDYWPAIAEVCRSHGVLLVADEVMTGFGRTGRWFGVEQWGVRPDILVAAKGATSGYWPFGFAAAAGPVYEAIRRAGALGRRRLRDLPVTERLSAAGGQGPAGAPTESGFSRSEMMIVAAARELAGQRVCFVGVGLPNIAVNLAQRTVNPDLELVYESGVFGARPARLPLSIGDPTIVTGATAVTSMFELFAYYLQRGLVDVGFLGAAQIDRFGNINTTVIGDYARPKVRLPGSGGACEIAINARHVFVIMRQSKRSFVERIDFRTSPGNPGGPDGARIRREQGWLGAGPSVVVTDLGIYHFDETGEMRLDSLHPGATLAEVRETIAWEPRVAEPLALTPPPTAGELRLIREELDPEGVYTK